MAMGEIIGVECDGKRLVHLCLLKKTNDLLTKEVDRCVLDIQYKMFIRSPQSNNMFFCIDTDNVSCEAFIV